MVMISLYEYEVMNSAILMIFILFPFLFFSFLFVAICTWYFRFHSMTQQEEPKRGNHARYGGL